MQRRWRAWLNDNLVDRWISNGRYYQLNLVRGDHANPEYRIADDVRIATESPVDFVSGITHALLSAMTFIAVLWTIGGALDLNLGGIQLHIPGFLVVAAVLYALIASGAMVLIGSRFVQVSETKNQTEAEYRYVLTRLRENGESIALIRGEEEERAGVGRSLAQSDDILGVGGRPNHEDDARLADLRLYRSCAADHPVRTEVPRRLDDARRGDAGGIGVHHRARPPSTGWSTTTRRWPTGPPPRAAWLL